MRKLTAAQEQFLKDEMYTPIELLYKPLKKKPQYKGSGNHSVKELEEICAEFEEYCHQQQIIKQNAIHAVVMERFKIDVNKL